MAAARPGRALGAGALGVKSLIIPILAGAALAPFVANTLKFVAAQRLRIIGIRLDVGARGGTHSTSTLDVQAAGVSLLSALFDVAALTPATPVDKEIASLTAGSQDIARNTELSIVTAVSGGSSPTWTNAMVQIDYEPLGD